ncbi:hypothetical protein ACB092_04G193300 [Castanea dentata]
MVQSAFAASSLQPDEEMGAIHDLENFFGAHQEFGGHLFGVCCKRIQDIWMKIGGAPQMHFEERANMLMRAIHLRQTNFLEFFLDTHLGYC